MPSGQSCGHLELYPSSFSPCNFFKFLQSVSKTEREAQVVLYLHVAQEDYTTRSRTVKACKAQVTKYIATMSLPSHWECTGVQHYRAVGASCLCFTIIAARCQSSFVAGASQLAGEHSQHYELASLKTL
eukprot:2539070-Amphidinium_carterae.1